MIYILGFLLPLLSTQVFGLECYVTDLISITQGTNVSSSAYVQKDCLEYYNDVGKLAGINLTIDWNMDMSCYTLDFDMGDGVNGTVKGCIPVGGCKSLEDSFDLAINQPGETMTVKHSDCKECTENVCNVDAVTIPNVDSQATLNLKRRFAVPGLLLANGEPN